MKGGGADSFVQRKCYMNTEVNNEEPLLVIDQFIMSDIFLGRRQNRSEPLKLSVKQALDVARDKSIKILDFGVARIEVQTIRSGEMLDGRWYGGGTDPWDIAGYKGWAIEQKGHPNEKKNAEEDAKCSRCSDYDSKEEIVALFIHPWRIDQANKWTRNTLNFVSLQAICCLLQGKSKGFSPECSRLAKMTWEMGQRTLTCTLLGRAKGLLFGILLNSVYWKRWKLDATRGIWTGKIWRLQFKPLRWLFAYTGVIGMEK
eukprot:Gb_40932 [translate_table: standard]